ncbi:MAG: helix-turn-helix transcriptional regulator [Gemmobacter sp.]
MPQPIRDARSLGEVLRAARVARGWTQARLAEAAGMQQHHVSNVENGLKDVKLTTLIALAVALDLDLALIPRRAPSPAGTDDIRDIF